MRVFSAVMADSTAVATPARADNLLHRHDRRHEPHSDSWAAQYNTWLLIHLTPKGAVVSFSHRNRSLLKVIVGMAAVLQTAHALVILKVPM